MRHCHHADCSRSGAARNFFAALVAEARAPLAQLAGHARLLAQHCNNDPAALRSIAAIQHSVVRLDALSSNGLVALGELSVGTQNLMTVDLSQLAALLQETFTLQAQSHGLGFEVRVPAQTTAIKIDTFALRQVLVNLIIHALDGIAAGRLLVSLSAGAQGLEVEIACEPAGFAAEHFGALVTTDELLQSNAGGSLGLAVSQQLLQQMRAVVELVPRQAGGHEIWIRWPQQRAATEVEILREPDFDVSRVPRNGGCTAIVAVQPETTAAAVAESLVALGVPFVSVQEAGLLPALMRDNALGPLILSSPFDGRTGRQLFKQLEFPAATPVLLLSDAKEAAEKTGWQGNRNCVQVAATAHHDMLHAALRAMLAK